MTKGEKEDKGKAGEKEKKEPQKKKPKIEDFVKKTRKDLTAKIKEKYPEKEAEKIIGGKQLRGVLSVLAYRAAGGKEEDYNKILETGAAMEGMHSTSLILDDIIDEDETRRGEPSLWVSDGVKGAILEAHSILSSSIDTFLSRGMDIAKNVVSGWGNAVKGEKSDVGMFKKVAEEIMTKTSIPEESYFNVIRKKTASFFSSAAKGGAQVAEAPEDIINHMDKYGEYCGIALQLADDMVDIGKGKLEGVMILPIILASHGEKVVRDKLLSFALDGGLKPSEVLRDLDIDVKEFFVPQIKKYVKKAQEEVDSMPESEVKPLLQNYPVFVTKEMLKEGGIKIRF